MFLYAGKAGRQWCLGIACLLGVVFAATPAFAQFDRGQISGVVKDDTGGVVPGVTVTATQVSTQTPRDDRDRRERLLHVPEPARRPLQHQRRAAGVQEGGQGRRPARRGRLLTIDFALATGAISENVTVTAEQTLLQTDVALRKTVEAKDIEQLSFSGRNPIGVAGLKPGVIGGSFNNYGFSDLGNGGFNINGSRTDENNITVDGATAIRTRSTGAIVGIQNVDAIQEVQVLTGNYMPEYGRASGGQIRMVTKSGSNRFSGSGSYFLRDDKLQANTWARNQQPELAREQRRRRRSTTSSTATRSAARSLARFKDKLFFFARAGVGQLLRRCRPTPRPCRPRRCGTGDFSELLGPNNGSSAAPQIITRSADRASRSRATSSRPNRLSRERHGAAERLPAADAGLPAGHRRTRSSPATNPQDQRKDNIRLDYRLNDKQPVHLPLRQVQLDGGRRVPRHVPVRAHRLGPAEHDADGELDEHASRTT